MNTQICSSCGSKEFRADRALGGRLICSNCSRPIGSNPYKVSSRTFKLKFSKVNLILLVLATIFIVLLIR